MDAISTYNLAKRFGTFVAVDHVNLSIKEGDVYALIGPNGAGKTTLIKLLVGLLIPSGGHATIFTHDVTKEPVSAKRFFGYVSDDPAAYEYLTGIEFLQLTGRLRGMKEAALGPRIKELVNLFPLGNILVSPISQYSRGNKQKVAFLASLLTRPKLLIIDEPIVGLDPQSIQIMGKTLASYALEGNTVFFVTHILSFAQMYAKRVGVMKAGKLVKEVGVTKHESLENFL